MTLSLSTEMFCCFFFFLGPRSRYVDILNPGKNANPGGLAPAPADIFAPLAPMTMPANLFVPSSGAFPMFKPINSNDNWYHWWFLIMDWRHELLFFVVAPDDQQPLEGSGGGIVEQNSPNAGAAPQVSLYIGESRVLNVWTLDWVYTEIHCGFQHVSLRSSILKHSSTKNAFVPSP